MGSMKFAVPILEGLHESHEVVLVVSQPDKPVGRKKVITPTPVKEKALELGIETFQPVNIKLDHKKITDLDLDLIVVAAYGQMIPENILTHAKRRAINVHASLLPKYRGGSPMHRAIQNGDESTGVTIMYMEKKMDSGDILSQTSIPIENADNVGILEEKLGVLGRDLLLETIPRLNEISPQKQDLEKVTYAWNIKPEEEKINFSSSAKEIHNHVRGFNPWPLTYCTIDDLSIKLYEVSHNDENISDNIGEIVRIDKQGVYIQTKDGLLILKDIQLQGKNRMKINDFMNGIGRNLLIQGKIVK